MRGKQFFHFCSAAIITLTASAVISAGQQKDDPRSSQAGGRRERASDAAPDVTRKRDTGGGAGATEAADDAADRPSGRTTNEPTHNDAKIRRLMMTKMTAGLREQYFGKDADSQKNSDDSPEEEGATGDGGSVITVYVAGDMTTEAAEILVPNRQVKATSAGGEVKQLTMPRLGRKTIEQLLRNEDVLFIEEEQENVVDEPPGVLNEDARDSHQVQEVYDDHGITGGSGISAGVWDEGKVLTTHQEFSADDGGSRAVQVDSPATFSDHASHVSGTVAARGVRPAARGMAVTAKLLCHDWNNDVAELVAAADQASATNHSYSTPRGWRSGVWQVDGVFYYWKWYGNPAVSPQEDYLFGKYLGKTAAFDRAIHENPSLAVFVAAANDRNDDGPEAGESHLVQVNGEWIPSSVSRFADGHDNGGFDTLGYLGICKNAITVGAIEDITVDPILPGHIRVAPFSCWGPTDDGRVKPDLVANGANLYSVSSDGDDEYVTKPGTSMATPAATGIAVLLAEVCQAAHGRLPRADEVKAALIHTAMSPEEGPSYRIGWGSIRADRAADLVAGTSGAILRDQVANQPVKWHGQAATGAPIRVTLVWVDPPGRGNARGLDDPTSTLVNDLDLVLIGPDDAHYYPWSLSRSAPASRATRAGANHTDNVERVDVPASQATTGKWTVKVTGPGVSQRFAISLTGLEDLEKVDAPDRLTE